MAIPSDLWPSSHFDEAVGMIAIPWKSPGYHTRIPNGASVRPTRETLRWALGVLERRDRPQYSRAERAIRQVLRLQDTDPTSRSYGIWPWHLEEPLEAMSPPDWNWADFNGSLLAELLVQHASELPPDLVAAMKDALGHAAWSIFRRNMHAEYTNIAVKGATVAILAGEILDEPRLLDYGRLRLQRQIERVAHHGSFAEYNSPIYTLVALAACENVLVLGRDSQARARAESLRETAWELIAHHFHPATGQWAGPHSRTYSDFLEPLTAESFARLTGASIAPHPMARSGGTELALPCPPRLAGRFQSLPAGTIAAEMPFTRGDAISARTGRLWMDAEACLGSINHDTLWTQRRALLAYWRPPGGPAAVLKLRFLHDGRDFASVRVRQSQQGPRVLTLFGLAHNQGDFHCSLDCPPDATFEAADFRVRYELIAQGASAAPAGPGRFALAAGSHRAILTTAAGAFGEHPVRWETGSAEDAAWIDGIAYHGPRRAFDFRTLTLELAAGLEILPLSENPAPAGSLALARGPAQQLAARWEPAPGLVLEAADALASIAMA